MFNKKNKVGRPKNSWLKKRLTPKRVRDRVSVGIKKDLYDKVIKMAERAGESRLGYIHKAIKLRMVQESRTLVEQADTMETLFGDEEENELPES